MHNNVVKINPPLLTHTGNKDVNYLFDDNIVHHLTYHIRARKQRRFQQHEL